MFILIKHKYMFRHNSQRHDKLISFIIPFVTNCNVTQFWQRIFIILSKPYGLYFPHIAEVQFLLEVFIIKD